MGTAVNNLVNCARDWGQKIHPETNQPQGLLKRLVAPRAAMVGAALCDVSQIAKNILHGAVQVPGVAAKWMIKPFSCISGSEALKKFENRFPGISDLLKTVARIVAYALGAAIAGTAGIIYPRAGIKLHDAMGLSYDKRAAVILAETKVPATPCCGKTEEPTAPVVEETVVSATNVVVASTQEEEKEEDIVADQSETVAEPDVVIAETVAEEATAVVVAETVAEKANAVVVAETASEVAAAPVIAEETTDYLYSTSEEDSVSEQAPVAAKGLKDYAWSAAATGHKAYEWISSTRLFKLATANEL